MKHARGADKRRIPPGPRGNLLLGSLRRVQHEPLELLREGFHEHGDIVRFRFGMTRAYLLAHPDHIAHVLHHNHRNYNKRNIDYAMLRRLLGNGLLTSDGAFWHRQRRLMAPMFHRQRIAGFCALMVSSTQEMLERWDLMAVRKEAFDVTAEMTRLTLAIVAKALFSADVSDDAEAIGAALTEVNRQLGEFSLLEMFWMVPTRRKRRFREAVAALDAVVGKTIDARRRAIHHNEDLLSMLLEAVDEETNETMTPRQVRDEVLTLLLAGHETTANALAWTWYLLALNPEAEQKLHDEISGVLGGRPPVATDVPRLSYTRMVIEESMRLYPPAWAISRNAIGEDEIGGYRVQRGTNMIICSFITHRHPAIWEASERFDPERFSPERSGGTAEFRISALRRGPANLYRQWLRDDRGATRTCDRGAALPAPPGARTSGGAASADHSAPARWDSYDAPSDGRSRRDAPAKRDALKNPAKVSGLAVIQRNLGSLGSNRLALIGSDDLSLPQSLALRNRMQWHA